jgi:hypothetical protein
MELLPGGAASFTAPVTGRYGLVVVNENGEAGSYNLSLVACTPPATLGQGVAYDVPGGSFHFLAAADGAPFVAVAARSTTASSELASFPGDATSCPGAKQKQTFNVMGHAAILVGLPGVAGPQFRPNFGPGVTGTLQGDDGRTRLVVNGCPATGTGSDLVRLWAVRVEAGGNYTFTLTKSGDANFRMLLFDPSLDPGVALDRYQAIESGTTILYPSSVSRELALCVLNDNGGIGTYSLGFEGCVAPLPAPADSAAPIASLGREAMAFFRMDPVTGGWGALGVRGGGWTTTIYANGSAGGSQGCPYGLMRSMGSDTGRVEMLAGRFGNGALPLQDYFPVATRAADCVTSAPGDIEWAPAGAELPVAGFVERTIEPGALLESWTAVLEGGRAYGIVFEPRDSADLKLLILSPDTAPGVAWLSRDQATIESARSVDLVVPGPADAKPWGLVVVNDNGKAGTYLLGIYPGGLDAGDPPLLPARTELRGLFPNPVRDALHVEYALRSRAHVRVEMLDLAGRQVALLEDGSREPGVWHLQWRPAASGAGLRPGLYLVRLLVDGRTLDRRKVTVLF